MKIIPKCLILHLLDSNFCTLKVNKYGTMYVKQTMKNETFIVVFEHCAFVLSKVLSHGYSLKCHDVETRLHTWTFGSSRLVAKQKRNSIPDSSSGSK